MKASKERRAYIILFAISVILSFLTLIFCVNIVNGTNSRTCSILEVVIINPVPQPSAGASLARVNAYHRFLGYEALYQELRCHK